MLMTVFVGKEGNKVCETARKQMEDHVRWKMWEYENFTAKNEPMEEAQKLSTSHALP